MIPGMAMTLKAMMNMAAIFIITTDGRVYECVDKYDGSGDYEHDYGSGYDAEKRNVERQQLCVKKQ